VIILSGFGEGNEKMNLQNKSILVTGADGFIGSHLTEMLINKGFKVKALAQYNSFNTWGWLEEFSTNTNLEIVSGDVRDAHFCKVLTKNIDVIFFRGTNALLKQRKTSYILFF